MSPRDLIHTDPAPRVRFVRLQVAMVILVLALAAYAGGQVLKRYRFALNETDSLPNWAFIVDQSQRNPKRGELVVFMAPPNPFYPPGMAFGKIVGGVPGDLVERHGRGFYVNGRFIGLAKTRARDGRVVEPGPVGRIPPGRYFVYTPNKDSLDSRYALVGWVPQQRILGLATPVM